MKRGRPGHHRRGADARQARLTDGRTSCMLVDGNSLTYRAFFALPTDLATASGQVTNAVFGFTSMLINLLRDHKPDDRSSSPSTGPSRRSATSGSTTYKATRDEAPDILRQQMGLVRQVVEVLRIPILEAPGFEADDIIATLATRARDRGRRGAHRHRRPRRVPAGRGPARQGPLQQAGRLATTPSTTRPASRSAPASHPPDYVQYAALRGDPSDNLPGVPGVGEKTAAKLINTYGDLDGIFAHVDEQTPKLRENLAEHEAQARLNAEVMVLLAGRPPRRRPRRPRSGALRRRGGAPALRLPRVPHPLRAAGRGASRATSARRWRRPRCSRPRSPRSTTAADAVAVLDGAGAGATGTVAVAGAWEGAPGPLARSRAWPW